MGVTDEKKSSGKKETDGKAWLSQDESKMKTI
jgi:hypothetical protein